MMIGNGLKLCEGGIVLTRDNTTANDNPENFKSRIMIPIAQFSSITNS